MLLHCSYCWLDTSIFVARTTSVHVCSGHATAWNDRGAEASTYVGQLAFPMMTTVVLGGRHRQLRAGLTPIAHSKHGSAFVAAGLSVPAWPRSTHVRLSLQIDVGGIRRRRRRRRRRPGGVAPVSRTRPTPFVNVHRRRAVATRAPSSSHWSAV